MVLCPPVTSSSLERDKKQKLPSTINYYKQVDKFQMRQINTHFLSENNSFLFEDVQGLSGRNNKDNII